MNMIIRVEKKIAKAIGAPVIICGNSGYTITFELDAEWHDKVEKTARFVWASATGVMKYTDQKFSGDTVEVPILVNIERVYVGLFAGELTTTTSATINCKKSILCQSAKEGGDPIINGDSAFIRYSAFADGTDFTETWDNSKRYIGIATGQFAPIDKSGYVWSVFASGLSAYELAVAQGFEGSEAEWFESLRGPTGAKIVSVELIGQDDNGGNIYRQTFDNGLTYEFTAPRGEPGVDGAPGKDGEPGKDGVTPTLQDWLGTEPKGGPTKPLYYDGEKFVEFEGFVRPTSLEEASWDFIASVAEAGRASDYFRIGEEKTVTLRNGVTVKVAIMGFNDQALANGTGNAGITFILVDLYEDCTFKSNQGGGISELPADVTMYVKKVERGGIFPIKSSELSNDYFTTGGVIIKYLLTPDGTRTAHAWWLQDVETTSTTNQGVVRDCSFVDVDGVVKTVRGTNNAYPSVTYGRCFGFCV